MKNKSAETKSKSLPGLTGHWISRAVCLGAVIVTCSSALAQNLYVSGMDASGGKISSFTWDGLESTFASGLRQPQGLAFDGAGNLYVADYGTSIAGSVIYKYTPDGARSIFAAGLESPVGMAFDGAGTLFVSDSDSGTIYMIKANGARSTFASGLRHPQGLAFDSTGKLYVADYGTGAIGSIIYEYKPNRVRSIFASGGPKEIFLFLAFQPPITLPPPAP